LYKDYSSFAGFFPELTILLNYYMIWPGI